ncbi:50S ribosomal protein L34 [Corallococcus interemptor]|uniref:50S ribosomal protein L34 n=1 Tax=Corallococcus interemptor TaxID=2316720 RepID=A0A3A8QE58_9BACT|nr:50S ribosomal protein L34 [Corallococcus interemptor]
MRSLCGSSRKPSPPRRRRSGRKGFRARQRTLSGEPEVAR